MYLPRMVALDERGAAHIVTEADLEATGWRLVGCYTSDVSYDQFRDDINATRKEMGIRRLP